MIDQMDIRDDLSIEIIAIYNNKSPSGTTGQAEIMMYRARSCLLGSRHRRNKAIGQIHRGRMYDDVDRSSGSQ
jgi:hypothetical protein